MITNITAQGNKLPFDWIDVTDPTEDELSRIAAEYDLHPASVADCLQPGHLPKYEEFDNHIFIILRLCYTQPASEADSVQELTSKIAIFMAEHFIITIHRKEWLPVEKISREYIQTGRCTDANYVLNVIVRTGLHSFDEPASTLTQSIDFFEKQVFLTFRKVPLLKGMYFLKRKLDVLRRLLLLTYDIVDKIDAIDTSNAYTRDIRDLFVKQKSLYDSMYENVNHLLNIYFNISSQRTNENMRVLTIFSVFFMPLTFIVGVYGMNFRYMPELQWKYGYPFSMLMMTVVTYLIYKWFRRKKWL